LAAKSPSFSGGWRIDSKLKKRSVLDTFFRDVKHSIRMFLKSPGFTLTAVAALTLGIGANTAIFSIVNAVLLKPVPVHDPDRFVMLMNTFVSPTGESGSGPGASPAKFQHWRAQPVLTEVSAFRTGVMNYAAGEIVEQVRSVQMSADGFHVGGCRFCAVAHTTRRRICPTARG
jgi:hypothetical protein